jgi:pilus assembly protein Flp/PilA
MVSRSSMRSVNIRSVQRSDVIMAMFQKVMRDTRGATAIEYALIASLISIAAISAFVSVGHGVTSRFTIVQTAVYKSL